VVMGITLLDDQNRPICQLTGALAEARMTE
jgi:hypothetical protein